LHVLELGRRHEPYHDAIKAVTEAGYVHRFQPDGKGALAFARKQEMICALGNTVVSVCFPSSTTHPERSGSVSTMTQRYLEGIASGALLVGESMSELSRLLGFDPVVPVEWKDPLGQLLRIVASPEVFQSTVTRARIVLTDVGYWEHRAHTVMRSLT